VDEVMRYLSGSIEKTEIQRFRALSVRVGVAGPYGSKAGPDFVNSVRESSRRQGRTVVKVIGFHVNQPRNCMHLDLPI
jgi:hypothetical protein